MPTHYVYRCNDCGLVEVRYRNSTKCRKCNGDIARLTMKEGRPATECAQCSKLYTGLVEIETWLQGLIEEKAETHLVVNEVIAELHAVAVASIELLDTLDTSATESELDSPELDSAVEKLRCVLGPLEYYLKDAPV